MSINNGLSDWHSLTIRALHQQKQTPIAHLCVSSQHFRPNADRDHPQHCAFIDASLGPGGLQIDCPDHQATLA